MPSGRAVQAGRHRATTASATGFHRKKPEEGRDRTRRSDLSHPVRSGVMAVVLPHAKQQCEQPMIEEVKEGPQRASSSALTIPLVSAGAIGEDGPCSPNRFAVTITGSSDLPASVIESISSRRERQGRSGAEQHRSRCGAAVEPSPPGCGKARSSHRHKSWKRTEDGSIDAISFRARDRRALARLPSVLDPAFGSLDSEAVQAVQPGIDGENCSSTDPNRCISASPPTLLFR